jgi:chemotaxis protein methyltransferase CheR
MTNANQIEHQREFSFSDSDFRFLAGLANQKTGIVLAEHKRDMVYGRLARRLRALGLQSFTEYCELLQSDAGHDELPNLVNAITTNLTGFFREAHHFEHLKTEAAKWHENGAKRIRVWSSACSSGMEPYSIAMTLKSAIPNTDKCDVRILATDIDSNMVNTGIAGEYTLSDVEQVPAASKQFIQNMGAGNRVKMSPQLKQLITFNTLNLLNPWPIKGPFDAIFCRNVVIYFDKATKQKLFSRMAELLPMGGWLYIGHSENLHGISDRFELVGRTIYRRVK